MYEFYRTLGGMVARMRRAMPGIAAVAAGLLLAGVLRAARRAVSSPGGSAPSTNGIGPITFAIGKDDPGWLQPA